MSQSYPDDSKWFCEEVQPLEPALRRYLRSRFPRLVDEDDIVQESYTRLLKARHSGRLQSARGLLFTIARNAAFDLFRKRRTVTAASELDVLLTSNNAATEDAVAIGSRQQAIDVVAEAVDNLPERCREVMCLRYQAGLSYKEIAERLGISPGTVKRQIATGIQKCIVHAERRGLFE
jgi:RNA polymerase sigma-70 factor (ECF subfamily)